MKLIMIAILTAAASASMANAQSLAVGTSYLDAQQQLSSRDRAPVRGADENANEEGLSTTQRRTTDYNKRIGKRVERVNAQPARIGIVTR